MKPARSFSTEWGFALVETLVAAALLVGIAVGVSQIVANTVRATVTARLRTVATVAAVQKMEQLRSLTWTETLDEASGSVQPVSDTTTDLSTEPISATGSGLLPSPGGTLDDNVPLYVDYLNGAGGWVGSGTSLPSDAVYVRRWSVEPLAEDPDNVVVLQVVVFARRDYAGRTPTPRAADVRLVCVKTRRVR